jgi:hypothetical protein
MNRRASLFCGILIGTVSGVVLFLLRHATGGYSNHYYDGILVFFQELIGFPIIGAAFGAAMGYWVAAFINSIREQEEWNKR